MFSVQKCILNSEIHLEKKTNYCHHLPIHIPTHLPIHLPINIPNWLEHHQQAQSDRVMNNFLSFQNVHIRTFFF